MRSVKTARISMLGIATISLALVLSGCGAVGGGSDEVTRSNVAEALDKEFASDPELKDAFPEAKRKAYADCVAGIVVKRGNKDDVKAWLEGKKKVDDIRGVDGDQTKDADFEACVKKAQ